MMFEVQDLAVASPATVSRCGMVYLEPSILGLAPFVRCWLQTVPETVKPFTSKLQKLFDAYLEPAIAFVRKNCKEICPTVDGNLTFSLIRILECYFKYLVPKEGEEVAKEAVQVCACVCTWMYNVCQCVYSCECEFNHYCDPFPIDSNIAVW